MVKSILGIAKVQTAANRGYFFESASFTQTIVRVEMNFLEQKKPNFQMAKKGR
ncbi:MAG: hypothetical protein LKE89_03830 [Lactobacillaceae bacterium]|jgi:hypothetical protein|nr:hypothetical protein [Lactobacillaceae bacterium]